MSKDKNTTNEDSSKDSLANTKGSSVRDKKTETADEVRQGRKSLTIPKGYGAKNKVRYVEGTTKLKDGCWLSDK